MSTWEIGNPDYPPVDGQDVYVLAEEDFDAADPDSLARFVYGDIGKAWRNIYDYDETNDVHFLVPGLEPVRPVLVIIDTQRGALPKLEDESDNATLNQVSQTLKTLAVRLGCAIMLVHHSPLSDSKRGAGGTSVRANADFEFAISGAKLYVTKNKYGPIPDQPYSLKLHTVTIPGVFDEEGEPITSCWPELVAPPSRVEKVADAIRDFGADAEKVRAHVEKHPGLSRSKVSDEVFGNHKGPAMEALANLEGLAYRVEGTGRKSKLYPFST